VINLTTIDLQETERKKQQPNSKPSEANQPKPQFKALRTIKPEATNYKYKNL